MDKNISIKFFEKLTDEKIKDETWKILCECDKEFYPPLSERKTFSLIYRHRMYSRLKLQDKRPTIIFHRIIFNL